MNEDFELFRIRQIASQEANKLYKKLESNGAPYQIQEVDNTEACIFDLWDNIATNFMIFVTGSFDARQDEDNIKGMFSKAQNPYPRKHEKRSDFDYTMKLACNICLDLNKSYKILHACDDMTLINFFKKIYKDGERVRLRSIKETPMGYELPYNLFYLFDCSNILDYTRILDTFFMVFRNYTRDYKAIGELTIATNLQCNFLHDIKERLIAEDSMQELEPIFKAYIDIYYNLYFFGKNFGLSFFGEIENGKNFLNFFHMVD